MKTIVPREKLLDILTKNKAEHESIFAAAKEGYLKAVQEALNKVADTFHDTKKLDLQPLHKLNDPQNYVTEYDDAIGMVAMTIQENIELEHDEYRQYVLDKWHFGRQFVMSNSAYVGGDVARKLSSKM
jgi:hypothetical protein